MVLNKPSGFGIPQRLTPCAVLDHDRLHSRDEWEHGLRWLRTDVEVKADNVQILTAALAKKLFEPRNTHIRNRGGGDHMVGGIHALHLS